MKEDLISNYGEYVHNNILSVKVIKPLIYFVITRRKNWPSLVMIFHLILMKYWVSAIAAEDQKRHLQVVTYVSPRLPRHLCKSMMENYKVKLLFR